MYFLLACRGDSCILRMRTRTIFRVTAEQSKQRQKRVSLRRTRGQIDFYIGSHPATFPHNSNSEKENHQTYAVAPCGRDILHGIWRHIWDGRNYSWSRVRARDIDPAVSAGAVVLAAGVHDWRAVERAARIGGLLRVGSARIGESVHVSASVSVAGRKHF